MDLKITNCNNFFKIRGILNKDTLGLFQNVFNNVFDKVENLTISIEDVESMDRYGVNAIAKLHKEALIRDKRLSVLGYGCKDLYNHFKTECAA
ncbi:hypothetical protein N1F78_08235 [Seonamhaeicola sp. MEBiC1930]|uniref:hypothetical protein n=1 Tax=Seonamhaeicola sp. MEBiC01930 TaxID=2976768 RepID=UPI00324A97CB